MNAAICWRCTVRPRVLGWPYCHECMETLRATARRAQQLAEYDPRGKEPLAYAAS